MEHETGRGRVVVVGAGVAGLSAARELRAVGWDVLVLEQSDVVGGKLRRAEVAGIGVDVGAEAMLNRRREGVDLARALGLEIEHPAVAASRIWTRGELRPLPRSLMGVPLDLDQLAACGVLSAEGLALVRREPTLGPTTYDGDVSVGALVDERFGPEVTDRLVEPLLGGVYAGDARRISARAAVPALLEYAARGSVLEQAGAAGVTTYASSAAQPVFAGIPGGMSRLAATLAASLVADGVEVRLGVTVRTLRRAPTGFVIETGPAVAPVAVAADRVVLATPPAATARLLGEVSPVAAAELGEVEAASVAVVTLAVRAADAGLLGGLGSGFLVPPLERRRIKAATFSFAKWAWVREAGRAPSGAGCGDDVLLLRTSTGRVGEERALQIDDDALVAAALAEIAAATGVEAHPVETHVQRWGGGLPQYVVGHVERVARLRAAVAGVPGLAVCGAAYDGVGVPAVIASARAAAVAIGSPLAVSERRGTMEP